MSASVDAERGHLAGGQPHPLPAGNPQVSDAGAGGGIHAGQALARAWRHRSRAPAGDQPSAPRRQDRHGLSRLRPAGGRADLRGQCRHDAGGQALRPGARLPPGHLCHVVDPRLDPGIHPALLVAGEDGHHGGAEEAVLQPAQAQGPDAGDRGRRPVARAGQEDRRAASTCPRQDVVNMNRRLAAPDHSLNAPLRGDGEGEWQDWLVDETPSQEMRAGRARGAGQAQEAARAAR